MRIFFSLFLGLVLLCPAHLDALERCVLLYFLDNDCPDCKKLNTSYLPELSKKYGTRLEIVKRDTEKTADFEAMMAFEAEYGIKPQDVPEIYSTHGVIWKPKDTKAAGWKVETFAKELNALIEKELVSKTSGSHGTFFDAYLKAGTTGVSAAESIIRNNVRTYHFILGAAVAGTAVSLLELACTGQVYLPTVLFIIGARGLELKAFILLVGYNLAFIAPLVAVLVLFWFGTGDKRLSAWLQKQGAMIKFAMGILFIALAILLWYFG